MKKPLTIIAVAFCLALLLLVWMWQQPESAMDTSEEALLLDADITEPVKGSVTGKQELFEAVEKGDLDRVKQLVAQGEDIHTGPLK